MTRGAFDAVDAGITPADGGRVPFRPARPLSPGAPLSAPKSSRPARPLSAGATALYAAESSSFFLKTDIGDLVKCGRRLRKGAILRSKRVGAAPSSPKSAHENNSASLSATFSQETGSNRSFWCAHFAEQYRGARVTTFTSWRNVASLWRKRFPRVVPTSNLRVNSNSQSNHKPSTCCYSRGLTQPTAIKPQFSIGGGHGGVRLPQPQATQLLEDGRNAWPARND